MRKIVIATILFFGLLIESAQAQKIDKKEERIIADINKSMKIAYCIFLNDSIEYAKVPNDQLNKFENKGYSSGYDVSKLTRSIGNVNDYLSNPIKSLYHENLKYYLNQFDLYPTFNSTGYRNALKFLTKKFNTRDSIESIEITRKKAEEKARKEEKQRKTEEEDNRKRLSHKIWDDYDMDSVTFLEQYGTIDQYRYQESIKRRSSHGRLCLLIGAKALWLYNLAYYLGSNDLNVTWDEPDDFKGVIIKATPKIYTTSTPPTIKVKAPYNDHLQITSVTITGPADDLINIFIGYWELTDMSFNHLKTKKAVTKDFVSDRVSFTWTGEQPTIKVIKNPDSPLDFFKIK